jgi:hypothetical protein
VKRSALIILTAIYLLSCVGIGFNRLYCCGSLVSVTVTYAMPDNTGKDAVAKKNCCRHENQSFKVKDSHFSATTATIAEPMPAILRPFNSLYNTAALTTLRTNLMYSAHAPPGYTATPAYILHCTYRI